VRDRKREEMETGKERGGDGDKVRESVISRRREK